MIDDVFTLERLSDHWITSEEFRQRLGVSPSGFRYLLGRRRLPRPIRLGGRCYWRPDDVVGAVNRRRVRLGIEPTETGRRV